MNIDTPSPTPLVKTAVKVRHIEFTGYAAATDHLIVMDNKGLIIADLPGATSGEAGAVRTGNVGWVDGIVVPTLTSGMCLIYFE
jgi:hypothetical protein